MRHQISNPRQLALLATILSDYCADIGDRDDIGARDAATVRIMAFVQRSGLGNSPTISDTTI